MTRTPSRLAVLGLGSLLALLALGPACGASGGAAKAAAVPGMGPTTANVGLPTKVISAGAVSLTVEVAADDKTRETGLMFRKSLEDGKGMLFVFRSDQILNFWMKNTTVPLSIAYLASDGTIRDIHDLVPLSLQGVASERFVRYALEVPQGWFGRVGLKVGDRFDLSGID